MLTDDEAVELTVDVLLPQWRAERAKLDTIDRWSRWDHDKPHKPRHATDEYKELADRSQAPWGDLIVGSVAQTLYVEGYRRPEAPEDSTGWRIWQANGMDARQVALHRAVLTYGIAYATGVPGRTLGGESMPVLRGVSPREMIAVYDDPANDTWPQYALRVRRKGAGYDLTVYDDVLVHTLRLSDLHERPHHVGAVRHGAGVCPVVRYTNRFDLEGRAAGEIEPFIPLLGRIDQTAFDRLVVQRFASWVVRTIAGMDLSESAKEAGVTVASMMMRLRANDILVAEDHDAKFGSLPATPLDGFIRAREADLQDLAAVSQTPAFELLGQLANLSAEALEAAKASQDAKSDERKHVLGESHEQLIRLGMHLAGDAEGAADFEAEVRWKDTSIRSLAQAVDAFGKMVQMLDVPSRVLWPKIPGFSQQDVDEARRIAEQASPMDALLGHLSAGAAGVDPETVKARADAMGVLIRAGVDPESAARQVGLDVEFTGAVPASLRLPESQAGVLEQV